MRFPTQLSLTCLAASLLAASGGCEKPQARAEPPPPKVTVANPQVREMIDFDQYNGWLDAAESVDVRARVRGHIQKIHFTDGQIVKKNDLLIELDPRPFEADVQRQKDQKDIYQSQLVAAQKEEARLKELLTRGGVSQSQADKAEAEAKWLARQHK